MSSCDGWSAYSSYHTKLQRCWAHLLREVEYVAERYREAERLSAELHALHDDPYTWRDCLGELRGLRRSKANQEDQQRLGSFPDPREDNNDVGDVETVRPRFTKIASVNHRRERTLVRLRGITKRCILVLISNYQMRIDRFHNSGAGSRSSVRRLYL